MRIHLLLIPSLVFFISINGFTQADEPVIYLLPGQGADERLFSKFEFPNHKVIDIDYPVPEDGTKMSEYARQLSTQIDTTKKFILIGTSIGGMLSSEMTEFMNPEKVIIISSAKNKNELPGRYNFQKKFPIYKLVGGWLAKRGALIMQPIVEPDRNKEKEIFVSMLKAKDKKFMKNSIRMIIEWDKESFDESIIHIHGNKDNTIPIKNVNYDYLIEDGSHMMTLTRSEELNALIIKLLDDS